MQEYNSIVLCVKHINQQGYVSDFGLNESCGGGYWLVNKIGGLLWRGCEGQSKLKIVQEFPSIQAESRKFNKNRMLYRSGCTKSCMMQIHENCFSCLHIDFFSLLR